MSDGSGIDWDALFPGANKQNDKATPGISYAPVIARSIFQAFEAHE